MKLLMTEGHFIDVPTTEILLNFPCDVIKLRVLVGVADTVYLVFKNVVNEVNLNS